MIHFQCDISISLPSSHTFDVTRYYLRPVTRKLGQVKIGPGEPLFAATPDQFWLQKLVRVAKSGPGVSTLQETIL